MEGTSKTIGHMPVKTVEQTPGLVSTKDHSKTLGLYIAEEQQILREAYQSFFLTDPSIQVVGSTGDTSAESLLVAAMALQPDVMLLGIRVLQPTAIEKLEAIREYTPDIAIVLLSAYFDAKGIKALREFFRGATGGCAYLLKHTIDSVEQLTQVVQSVGEGRIILDQAVMEGLISNTDTHSTVLGELSAREMEVLSWMAKGYRNGAIAEVLCLEPKTVERHINSIYGKLGDGTNAKHMRVHTTNLYLKATGQISGESFGD